MIKRYVFKYMHTNADGVPFGHIERIDCSFEQLEDVQQAIFTLANCGAIKFVDTYYYEYYELDDEDVYEDGED